MAPTKSLNVRLAVKWWMRGRTYDEIAHRLGVRKQSVHRALKGIFALLEPGKLEAYRERRGDAFDAAEYEAMNLLAECFTDPQKRKKTTVKDAAVTLGIVLDKNRLIHGESTMNMALHSLVEQIERQQERAQLRAALGDETPAQDSP